MLYRVWYFSPSAVITVWLYKRFPLSSSSSSYIDVLHCNKETNWPYFYRYFEGKTWTCSLIIWGVFFMASCNARTLSEAIRWIVRKQLYDTQRELEGCSFARSPLMNQEWHKCVSNMAVEHARVNRIPGASDSHEDKHTTSWARNTLWDVNYVFIDDQFTNT